MRKRKYPDSGHGSRPRRSKRRYKLEKDLRSVPHKNLLEHRKCTLRNMGAKDLQSTTERSKCCVRQADKSPRNGDSHLGTDVCPPVTSTFMRKKIHDRNKVNHRIESVVGPPGRKLVSENLNAVSVADNQVSALAEKGDSLKMAHADPEENISISFKEAAATSSLPVVQSSCSADSLARSDVVDKDWKKKKIHSNSCSYPIVGSTDGLTSDNKSRSSSHDVHITYTKKKRAVNRKHKDISFVSKVTKETQAPGNKTLVDNSSLIETADVGAPSNHYVEASISSNIMLAANSGSSSKKVDGDIAQMSSTVCKDGSNSVILRDTSSNHHERHRRRRKNKSSGTNSAMRGSDETSLLSNQATTVEKETDAVTNSIADSKMDKMFPQIDSAPKVTKRKRSKKKKGKLDNSQSVETIKNNVKPNIDNEDRDSNKCTNRASSNETNLSPEMSSKLCKLKVTSSIQGEKGGEKEGSLSDFAYDIQQICSDAPCTFQPVAASDGANGSNRVSASVSQVLKVSSDVTKNQDDSLNLSVLSSTETFSNCSRKKLLILDLNGFLADIKNNYYKAHKVHERIGRKLVVSKRPFCDDFLKFCFERFHVGIWSSRKRCNVDKVVDYLMGNLKHKLLFCWDQSECTDTGYTTIENKHKPLVLKELKKLWNKDKHDLPWERGEYSPSNTLLVDDSPYKAICNPPHTAIFPYPYNFTNENDNSLGPGGDLCVYLEGLAMAADVQLYVREHPFGQKAIADSNPSWNFYLKIIDQVQKSSSLTT